MDGMTRDDRIGFILSRDGFAAVLYTRTTQDATARSPWTQDVDLAMAWGTRWADQLRVPCDVVRVSTSFLRAEEP
jgi:hypothetical protein